MLIVNQQEITLGSLKFGKAYTFKYHLINPEESSIVIKKAIAGCNSCTTTSFSTSPITKDKGSELTVIFTPGSTGIQSKSINLIYEEDGKVQPQLLLKFKATVPNE